MNRNTRDWLDLYDLMLDRLAEMLKDPLQAALSRGITEKELQEQQSVARLPSKMKLDAHHELMASWKRVRTSIQLFGLELGEDLEIAPLAAMDPKNPKFAMWVKNPVLEISRGLDKPLTFKGRDALTAHGFLNMYIQQCDTLDPSAKIKKDLEARGITKENFREKMYDSVMRSPWDEESPPAVKG